jgi:DnaB helicase-like protein
VSDSYKYPESYQRRLLAAMIRQPRKMNGLIEPEYFQNPIHIELAKIAKDVYSSPDTKDAKLSKATVTAMVKANLSSRNSSLWPLYRRNIRKIFNQEFSDLQVLHKEALAFSKHMKFKKAILLCEKDIANRKYDSVFVRINALKSVGDNERGLLYWDDITNAKRWKEDRVGMVSTMYLKLLDQAMGGGVAVGELALIEGGGKGGKSTLLGRIAAGAMWRGTKVAIASCELSDFKYRKRIDAMLSNIPYKDLYSQRAGKGGTRDKLKHIRQMCKGNIMIRQFPSGKAKIRDIEAWLDILEEQDFHPELLVVDYLALLQPNEMGDSKRENIGQATVELRGVAVERKLPIWTAAQVNRAGLNKPMLGPTDLAEDISQFFTVDFIVAICQTDKERGTREDREEGKPEKGRLILAAARDVASGATIDIQLNRDRFQIKELGWGKYAK